MRFGFRKGFLCGEVFAKKAKWNIYPIHLGEKLLGYGNCMSKAVVAIVVLGDAMLIAAIRYHSKLISWLTAHFIIAAWFSAIIEFNLNN